MKGFKFLLKNLFCFANTIFVNLILSYIVLYTVYGVIKHFQSCSQDCLGVSNPGHIAYNSSLCFI